MNKNFSKKSIIIIALICLVVFITVTMLIFRKRSSPAESPAEDIVATQTPETINIVGTWYSDKPDCVTFSDDGSCQFSEWNGGYPSMDFPGSFSLSGNTVTYGNSLDGDFTLNVRDTESGYILVGKYTYYPSEEAARAAISAAAIQAGEEEKNLVPNTVAILKGEWLSVVDLEYNPDSITTCTISDTQITIHTPGSEYVPESTVVYAYEILSDKKIKLSIVSGSDDILLEEYDYSINENSDGSIYFWCNGLMGHFNFVRDNGAGGPAAPDNPVEDNTPTTDNGKIIPDRDGSDIKDTLPAGSVSVTIEVDPDLSEYTEELNAYATDAIIGAWVGTFSERPTEESDYWRYTFSDDGTYSFRHGDQRESGTYTVTSDPNNYDYHSTLHLTYGNDNFRSVQFYLTTTSPAKMQMNDEGPTYTKL